MRHLRDMQVCSFFIYIQLCTYRAIDIHLQSKGYGKKDNISIISVETRSQSFVDEPAIIYPLPLWRENAFHMGLLAALLLLAIFVLQVLGLHYAVKGAQGPTPLVSYCCPFSSLSG